MASKNNHSKITERRERVTKRRCPLIFPADNCRRNRNHTKTIINIDINCHSNRCQRQSAHIRARIVFVQCEWIGVSKSICRNDTGKRFGFRTIWNEWYSIFVDRCWFRAISCQWNGYDNRSTMSATVEHANDGKQTSKASTIDAGHR